MRVDESRIIVYLLNSHAGRIVNQFGLLGNSWEFYCPLKLTRGKCPNQGFGFRFDYTVRNLFIWGITKSRLDSKKKKKEIN